MTIALVLSAAVTVIYVAEAFADALIETGGALGIDEFLLVQWLAPLASLWRWAAKSVTTFVEESR